jgi:hypothetical protein
LQAAELVEHNMFIIMKQLAQAAQEDCYIQQQLLTHSLIQLLWALEEHQQILLVQIHKHLQKALTPQH